jgi:hypothetical protein
VGDADCLLPPEKKNNCSNETQGNYVADIAFASAKLSFGSVKRIVGDFLFFLKKKVCFLEMLFGVLSVLRHSSAPAFSLIFI